MYVWVRQGFSQFIYNAIHSKSIKVKSTPLKKNKLKIAYARPDPIQKVRFDTNSEFERVKGNLEGSPEISTCSFPVGEKIRYIIYVVCIEIVKVMHPEIEGTMTNLKRMFCLYKKLNWWCHDTIQNSRIKKTHPQKNWTRWKKKINNSNEMGINNGRWGLEKNWDKRAVVVTGSQTLVN